MTTSGSGGPLTPQVSPRGPHVPWFPLAQQHRARVWLLCTYTGPSFWEVLPAPPQCVGCLKTGMTTQPKQTGDKTCPQCNNQYFQKALTASKGAHSHVCRHLSPTRSRGRHPDAVFCSDPETEEQHGDRGHRHGSPEGSSPPSLSSVPPVSVLSLIFTPQYSVQSGREVLTTGSQGAHPEVPKGFLVLTLVTVAVQFRGWGVPRVDRHTRNTLHGRIIITIIITISYIQDKPSCPRPTSKSICPAAPV